MIGSTSQRDAGSTARDDWRGSLRTPPKTGGTDAGASREHHSTAYVTGATHPRGWAPCGAPVGPSRMPHEKRHAA